MSSIFGRSPRSFQSKADQEFLRRRVQERPANDVLATDDLNQVTLNNVERTPDVLTPRISEISSAVIGCLYAMTASVSSP